MENSSSRAKGSNNEQTVGDQAVRKASCFRRTGDQQFERPYVSNERMAKPFERNEVCNERVTKLFERPDVSNEWVIKSFERLDKQLVNGKTLVYVFPWKVTAPNVYSSLL